MLPAIVGGILRGGILRVLPPWLGSPINPRADKEEIERRLREKQEQEQAEREAKEELQRLLDGLTAQMGYGARGWADLTPEERQRELLLHHDYVNDLEARLDEIDDDGFKDRGKVVLNDFRDFLDDRQHDPTAPVPDAEPRQPGDIPGDNPPIGDPENPDGPVYPGTVEPDSPQPGLPDGEGQPQAPGEAAPGDNDPTLPTTPQPGTGLPGTPGEPGLEPAPSDPAPIPPNPDSIAPDSDNPAEPFPSQRPPELPGLREPKPWDPPAHPVLPRDEPPFGEPQTPHGPGREDGDSGPADPARLLESIINQIIASIAPGNPEQPDSPEGEKLTLPAGEVPIPSPDDPRYPLLLAQPDYRREYWEATGHSPIGKIVHHAIEQSIFKYYPELFDQALRDSAENLRGIWLGDNNRIHLSAIRRAWDDIYERLEIRPRKNGPTLSPDKLTEVKQGIELGVLLIDIFFGQWMVPVPQITGSGLAREILRSLDIEDSIIDTIGRSADPRDLLLALGEALSSWAISVQHHI